MRPIMSDNELPVKMNRDFKGIWIPREIWLNKSLSIQAKALWAEISSLHDRESGGCYASNEYLCDFMNVKITRLKEIMKELRDSGFLVDVSFDGRHRIIRAEMPEVNYGGQQHAGKPAPSQPENRHAASLDSGCPSYYIDTSIEKRIETPPIPPQISDEIAAKAAEEKTVNPPKVKKLKTSSDFPDEVNELSTKLIQCLILNKPDYLPPKNMSPFLTHVDFILRIDKRDPQKVLNVFAWALADSFWSGNMYKPNPVEYLRKKFDQLDKKMNTKVPAKERKFAPCSDDAKALADWEANRKYAL